MPIDIEKVDYIYRVGTPQAVEALRQVQLTVSDGEMLAIIGPTGAGKSTLIQLMNGLLQPTRGSVNVDGLDLAASAANRHKARHLVGLALQYPEQQLFAETVFADVAFGPKQQGLNRLEVEARVVWALETLGVPPALWERSPFSLSGGQQRLVALAGTLARQPRYLVLDEPTAGLDGRARIALLDTLRQLNDKGMTVIIVTHDLDLVAEYCRRTAVMAQGRLAMVAPTAFVFSRAALLAEIGLGLPQVAALMMRLNEQGVAVDPAYLTPEQAAAEIERVVSPNA